MPKTKTERMHCTREEWREAKRRWGASADAAPEQRAPSLVAAASTGWETWRSIIKQRDEALRAINRAMAVAKWEKIDVYTACERYGDPREWHDYPRLPSPNTKISNAGTKKE